MIEGIWQTFRISASIPRIIQDRCNSISGLNRELARNLPEVVPEVGDEISDYEQEGYGDTDEYTFGGHAVGQPEVVCDLFMTWKGIGDLAGNPSETGISRKGVNILD